MSMILPGLLQQISHSVEIAVEGTETTFAIKEILGSYMNQDSEQPKMSVNTYETEEKELGIQTLLTFVDQLQQSFQPYIPQALEVVYPLVNYTLND